MPVAVDLHLMRASTLAGREDELRPRIAGRYRKASRSGVPALRLEELAAGVLLSEVLGAADDVDLRYGSHGKPELVTGSPQFNISHDGGLVALAVADEPLGVDVMKVPVYPLKASGLSLARRFFSKEERAAIADGTTLDQACAFARAWTSREAALKAEGTGFSVDPREHPELLADWQLAYVEPQGAIIAVATRQTPMPRIIWHADI